MPNLNSPATRGPKIAGAGRKWQTGHHFRPPLASSVAEARSLRFRCPLGLRISDPPVIVAFGRAPGRLASIDRYNRAVISGYSPVIGVHTDAGAPHRRIAIVCRACVAKRNIFTLRRARKQGGALSPADIRCV